MRSGQAARFLFVSAGQWDSLQYNMEVCALPLFERTQSASLLRRTSGTPPGVRYFFVIFSLEVFLCEAFLL